MLKRTRIFHAVNCSARFHSTSSLLVKERVSKNALSNSSESKSLSLLEKKLSDLKYTSLIGLSEKKKGRKNKPLSQLKSEFVQRSAPQALEHTLSLIYACIQNNKIDEAERKFNRLWWSNMEQFRPLFDIKLINAFIEAHVDAQKDQVVPNVESDAFLPKTPHLQRASLWLKRIPEFCLKPNARSYGLILSYYVEHGRKEESLQLLQHMHNDSIDCKELFALDIFLDKEIIETLKLYLKEAGYFGRHELHDFTTPDTVQLLTSALSDAQCSQVQQSSSQSPENDLISELKAIDLVQTRVGSVPVLQRLLKELQSIQGLDSYDRQQWLEERSFAAAKEVFENQRENLPASLAKIVDLPVAIMSDWQMKLERVIRSKLKALKHSHQEPEMMELLSLLPPESLARITVVEFFQAPFLSKVANNYKNGLISDSSADNQVKVRSLAMRISEAIEREAKQKSFKTRQKIASKKLDKKVQLLYNEGNLFDDSTRKAVENDIRQHEQLNEPWSPDWDQISLLSVGSWLIHALQEVALVQVDAGESGSPEFVPAFKLALSPLKNSAQTWFLNYHPKLFDIASHSSYNVDPWQLPMLTRPRPWITIHNGGYLQQKGQVMRLNGNIEHAELVQEADNQNHLSLVLKALDVLGATAWKVNAQVLKVAIEMWNSGQDAPYMPSITKYETVPENPKEMKIMREKMSQRCDTNYKMEIAKAFLGETIYFPHNLDFRGRAYPVPTHLNHMGSDLCRGLLQFAHGKELGEEGLKWLKIHLSNLAGCDKVSHADRIAFSESHLSEIMDSADNPISGKKWWLQSDDSWQLLAACFELTAALRSDDPHKYISSLPVHQDGSCNGLQHYAALGGDPLGAQSVNLISSVAPNDVYSDVAKEVKAKVERDTIGDHDVAKEVVSLINRKLVKQTVMTSTYGVTFVGARDQVKARLKELTDNQSDISPEKIQDWSLYLTKVVFESIGTLFEGAQALQKWLNVAARTVASSIHVDDIPDIELKDSEFILSLQGIDENLLVDQEAANEHHLDHLLDAATLDTNPEVDFDDMDPGDGMVDDILQEFDLNNASERLVLGAKGASQSPMKLASVVWTTPLGLPIAQPYRKFRTFTVRTHLQSFQVFDKRTISPVNSRKQSTAFPPNFIHSLDASHMMLAALRCQQKGIEFAAVHDSFWTHASDVPVMNSIIRETFVKLHQSPLLENLRRELMERFKHHKLCKTITITNKDHLEQIREYFKSQGRRFSSRKTGKTFKVWTDFEVPALPPRGSLDLKCVLQSPYFFH